MYDDIELKYELLKQYLILDLSLLSLIAEGFIILDGFVFLRSSHCGELFNDLGDGVLLTHVVDVHSSEGETAV